MCPCDWSSDVCSSICVQPPPKTFKFSSQGPTARTVASDWPADGCTLPRRHFGPHYHTEAQPHHASTTAGTTTPAASPITSNAATAWACRQHRVHKEHGDSSQRKRKCSALQNSWILLPILDSYLYPIQSFLLWPPCLRRELISTDAKPLNRGPKEQVSQV